MDIKINGAERLSAAELRQELQNGARVVAYGFCISIVVMSFKRGSGLYLLRAGEADWGRRLGFSVLSLVAGPWGIPWGPIWTVSTIFTNVGGGRDVSAELLAALRSQEPMPTAAAAGATL
ncbi:hypothetical protein ACG04R_19295 [Roseateles sp. BYS78W]|uniref:Uncharacterized protein n=1 Tax=Pelomonas candidula TaxID=3299025 RepID=A0ABW7HFZ9_9BURK